MFKCGKFKFKAGDLVDFNDMTVPCNEMVAVTIIEEDVKFNDGHTVMVPCKPNSEMTVDLVVPKGGNF